VLSFAATLQGVVVGTGNVAGVGTVVVFVTTDLLVDLRYKLEVFLGDGFEGLLTDFAFVLEEADDLAVDFFAAADVERDGVSLVTAR
jgi:hypothetical protein